MFKKVICFLFLFFILPVFAGEYENALKNNDNVFLYLTMPSCTYCKKFDEIYDKLVNEYGEKCKFLKIDTTTAYGRNLASRFGIKFVPYVVLVESKKDKGTKVTITLQKMKDKI